MGIPILGGIVKDIFGKVGDVVSEVVVDKDKRNQIKADLVRLELELTDKAEERVHQEMLAQIDVNKVEAGSSNIFVAGWRPAAGWIGVASLGSAYLIIPIASWTAKVIFGYDGGFPVIETEGMMWLLGGMLGLGGLRSWEKIKGVKTEEPNPMVNKAVSNTSSMEKSAPTPAPAPITLPEDVPWSK